MNKPDCYKCVFRGTVAGDAHSRCLHPLALAKGIEATLGFNLGAKGVKLENKELNLSIEVEGNRHGISSGWFMWPINFDPVWLEKCTGFKSKPKVDK